MATKGINLSSYNKEFVPNGAGFRIGIVVSSWNEHITMKLLEGANLALLDNGVLVDDITIKLVPGAFELPLGAQLLLESTDLDGVIAIGSVIQGETKHFDFVCAGTTQGLMDVMLKHSKPVAFCVLTDQNEQQSIDRSGGIHGNKGIECAIACLKMIAFKKEQSKNRAL
jgi:6,7-dimethyl-8-ribityllumazine synthase